MTISRDKNDGGFKTHEHKVHKYTSTINGLTTAGVCNKWTLQLQFFKIGVWMNGSDEQTFWSKQQTPHLLSNSHFDKNDRYFSAPDIISPVSSFCTTNNLAPTCFDLGCYLTATSSQIEKERRIEKITDRIARWRTIRKTKGFKCRKVNDSCSKSYHLLSATVARGPRPGTITASYTSQSTGWNFYTFLPYQRLSIRPER